MSSFVYELKLKQWTKSVREDERQKMDFGWATTTFWNKRVTSVASTLQHLCMTDYDQLWNQEENMESVQAEIMDLFFSSRKCERMMGRFYSRTMQPAPLTQLFYVREATTAVAADRESHLNSETIHSNRHITCRIGKFVLLPVCALLRTVCSHWRVKSQTIKEDWRSQGNCRSADILLQVPPARGTLTLECVGQELRSHGWR